MVDTNPSTPAPNGNTTGVVVTPLANAAVAKAAAVVNVANPPVVLQEPVVPNIPIGHNVTMLINVVRGKKKIKAIKKAIRRLQINGPYVWDGFKPPVPLPADQIPNTSKGPMFSSTSTTIDGIDLYILTWAHKENGIFVKPDYYFYLGGEHMLHFRTRKSLNLYLHYYDRFFNSINKRPNEGKGTFAKRKLHEARLNAVRATFDAYSSFVLNKLMTVDKLEKCGLIHEVRF